jgi:hypothetical protein
MRRVYLACPIERAVVVAAGQARRFMPLAGFALKAKMATDRRYFLFPLTAL